MPAIALPPSVKNYEKLWADVCQYRAADIKFHGRMCQLLEMAKAADALTAQDEDTAAKLAKLANELVDAYNRIKGEKWLIDAKRKLQGIDARARSFSSDAVKKVKLAVERHERALKEKREAESAAENMKGRQSYRDYMLSQITFARAINNLRVKKHDAAKINNN